MPARLTYCAGTFSGSALPTILSARCSFGFDMQVSEAVIYVPTNPAPGSQPYDAAVTLTLGSGTHNVQRFSGVFRRYDYSLYPRKLGLVCYGNLVRAQQYENNEEGAGQHGGLDYPDLVGSGGGSDQAIVQAVLAKVPNLSFSNANIGGTGTTLGPAFTQRIQCLGGGSTDTHTPAPPI